MFFWQGSNYHGMAKLDEVFVADAVTHAYNFSKSNYRLPRHAELYEEGNYGLEQLFPEKYRRTKETYLSDWPAEATTNVLFKESQVDFAVFHPQSISIFKDGLTAEEKAIEFVEQNPNQGAALASVDLIWMDNPLEELTGQVEEFGCHGVKLYPSYWEGDEHYSFSMDDPDIAFPLFEHAVDLGLDVIAVHKSLPLGAVPTKPYEPSDVSEAASSFPELNFEIVHGGVTFAEEIGAQIGIHSNIYICKSRSYRAGSTIIAKFFLTNYGRSYVFSAVRS